MAFYNIDQIYRSSKMPNAFYGAADKKLSNNGHFAVNNQVDLPNTIREENVIEQEKKRSYVQISLFQKHFLLSQTIIYNRLISEDSVHNYWN